MKKLLTILATLLPMQAVAHPHVFIDTGLEVIFDEEGRLTHVRVTWSYDEFYSLLITEDYKLDSDFDGVLTEAEQAELTGFDAKWVQGYNGDLVVTLDGQPLVLSGPLEPGAKFEDGRITSTHLREVSGTPFIQGDVLSLKAFDETFYTAYDVTLPIKISGMTSCLIERVEPDIDGQLANMQAQLLRLDANADLEENDIPLIGGEFATDILISCPNT